MRYKGTMNLTALTDEQKQLIENGYSIVEKSINGIISNHLGSGLLHGNKKDLIKEAMSYLVEATQSYNKSTHDLNAYTKYASFICVYRLIDQYRKMYKHNSNNIDAKNEAQKIKNANVDLSDDDIIEELYKRGFDVKYGDIIPTKLVPLSEAGNLSENNTFKTLEWEDTKQHILSNLEKFFENEKDQIYKTLLTEYLIPKCSGDSIHTSLADIATRFGKSPERVSQILRDQKMKEFVRLNI